MGLYRHSGVLERRHAESTPFCAGRRFDDHHGRDQQRWHTHRYESRRAIRKATVASTVTSMRWLPSPVSCGVGRDADSRTGSSYATLRAEPSCRSRPRRTIGHRRGRSRQAVRHDASPRRKVDDLDATVDRALASGARGLGRYPSAAARVCGRPVTKCSTRGVSVHSVRPTGPQKWRNTILVGPVGRNDVHRNGRAEHDTQVRHGRWAKPPTRRRCRPTARPFAFSMPSRGNPFPTMLQRSRRRRLRSRTVLGGPLTSTAAPCARRCHHVGTRSTRAAYIGDGRPVLAEYR